MIDSNDDYLDSFKPLEIEVYKERFEDAVRRFRTLVQKEKIITNYREKQSYEKPSAKKRRIHREAKERIRIAKLRAVQVKSGEWERRQRKKEEKIKKRLEEKLKRQQENEAHYE